MEDSRMVEVMNRVGGTTTYIIPEMQNLKRTFTNKEKKLVPFEELRRLMYVPGGEKLLRDYLIIEDKEVLKALGLSVEPEYFYNEDEIKYLFEKGSLEEFLDCLDFAPQGVIDTIKTLAVNLPLNDVAKRQAILDKTGFDVTRSIELNLEPKEEVIIKGKRRAAVPSMDEKDQVKVSSTERRVQK